MNLDEYHIQYEKNRLWESMTWLGVPCWKLPGDAWMIQELIFKVKPTIIIETGTGFGGSALFYACILELIGTGQVITIDKEYKIDKMLMRRRWLYAKIWFKRVNYIVDDSLESFNLVSEKTKHFYYDPKIMVILDSDHRKEHVIKEMELYGQLVSKGSYMIVEDTHINGHPVPWDYGDGPYEAVQEFMKTHDEFMIDKNCEKYGITFNPNGYLRKIR